MSKNQAMVLPIGDSNAGKALKQRFSSANEAVEWRLLILACATFVIWVGFHAWTGVFITPRNLANLSVQMTITGLLSIGLTWLLVAREIDLSVGAILALCGVVAMQLHVVHGLPAFATVAATLMLGILVGTLQGVLRVSIGIPSFIITLAGFSWLRGTAYVISGAETVSGASEAYYALGNGSIPSTASVMLMLALGALGGYQWLRRYTAWFGVALRARRRVNFVTLAVSGIALAAGIWVFGTGRGLPYPLVILGVAVFAAEYISRNTKFGRYIYASGGSPESARRAGIRVDRVTLYLFAIMGGLAGLAGILQTSRLDSGPPNLGQFLALDAISASVIGGTSLFGGVGRVSGAVIGALLMTSITNGLSLAGVNTFYQMIVTGLLLVVAVAFDRAAQGRTQ